MSLMRNLDISPCGTEGSTWESRSEEAKNGGEDVKSEGVSELGLKDLESCSSRPRVFGDLPPQALNYIQQLQSELTNAKEVTFFFASP